MLQHPYSIYKFDVKSYHSDQHGRLTIYSLFHFLQECAWDNARLNDFGYETLEKANSYWVLSRVLVQLNEFPKWKDEISIKTWPKGTDGFFALRDFNIRKDNQVIGRATTSWLILDKETRRPRRLDGFNFDHDNFHPEHAINKKLEKITFSNPLQATDMRRVYSSDLDVNKHVNNATYVRWIVDALQLYDRQISEFEINFISELLLNEQFIVSVTELSENMIYISLNHTESQREICRARVLFQ